MLFDCPFFIVIGCFFLFAWSLLMLFFFDNCGNVMLFSGIGVVAADVP